MTVLDQISKLEVNEGSEMRLGRQIDSIWTNLFGKSVNGLRWVSGNVHGDNGCIYDTNVCQAVDLEIRVDDTSQVTGSKGRGT